MATTPRPLDWKPAILITTDAQDAVKSVQFEDGNADIIYKQNKKSKYKYATITQGHWETMSLDSALTYKDARIKDMEIVNPIVEELYTLEVRISNRPFLYKKNLITDEELEFIITSMN